MLSVSVFSQLLVASGASELALLLCFWYWYNQACHVYWLYLNTPTVLGSCQLPVCTIGKINIDFHIVWLQFT